MRIAKSHAAILESDELLEWIGPIAGGTPRFERRPAPDGREAGLVHPGPVAFTSPSNQD
ncbi:MAG TPA: hypothetical protein VKB38_09380 [Terracidiphilus sp.]|nr:hypothetical protein [Terracidiphilus sp.]